MWKVNEVIAVSSVNYYLWHIDTCVLRKQLV